jgi:hypothetical protein
LCGRCLKWMQAQMIVDAPTRAAAARALALKGL